MTGKPILAALGLALLLTLAGCGDSKGNLGDPKSSIAHQLDLLKAGDVDRLRECFTPRLRDQVTRERVQRAQGKAGTTSVDELVSSVETGEFQGQKFAKIKMKNGRTLTTLVLTDGKWLSDTLWFR
jgi:hypothetical protein